MNFKKENGVYSPVYYQIRKEKRLEKVDKRLGIYLKSIRNLFLNLLTIGSVESS